MTNHVVMFSSGAGSAMAAKRVATARVVPGDTLTLLFADVGEHEDNYRFLHEAHEWIGGDLVILTNDGRTIWDVFKAGRFLGNSRVDLCSRVLKREPMRKWLEATHDPADTVVYLGFDWTEEHRLAAALKPWEPWTVSAPLMAPPFLTKWQIIDTHRARGIEPCRLYLEGFSHANCGGACVRGGQAQWALLHSAHPDRFRLWEAEEEQTRAMLGKDVAILRDRTGGESRPLTLRSFRERITAKAGLFDADDWGACGCTDDAAADGTPE